MAKNITPSMSTRENEIQGLLAWSLSPVRVLSLLSLLIGFQRILSISSLEQTSAFAKLAQAMEGLTFGLVAMQSFQFSRFAKQYSLSDEDKLLSKTMVYLGGFWASYALTLIFASIPLFIQISTQYLEFSFPTTISVLWWLFIPALIVLILALMLRSENQLPFVQFPFTKHIASFAKLNLVWTRSTSFMAVSVGFLYVGVFTTYKFINTPLGSVTSAVCGFSFIFTGGALAWVWRGVREIHRNPTLIYFERTMERLNLFWLIACFGFLIHLCAKIFE